VADDVTRGKQRVDAARFDGDISTLQNSRVCFTRRPDKISENGQNAVKKRKQAGNDPGDDWK
jgi:hypothetical protein